MALCKKHTFAFSESPEINLTPLIDVVFVLLISFIIVAPLLEIEHIQLANSGPHKALFSSANKEHLEIYVHKDNSVSLNKEVLAIEALFSHFFSLKQEHPQAHPKLFCDKSASFGTYQLVKNTLEEAGFEEMDLVLLP